MTGPARHEPSRRLVLPEAITSTGVVAIGRGVGPQRAVEIGDALLRGGVRAFEVTLGARDGIDALEVLAKRHASSDALLIGAGTVLDVASADRALSAGARFLVMPHTDEVLVRWAADRGIAAFPGALTPTEILRGWHAGAAAVKLFPASVAGAAFVHEFRAPFPDIPLIPTGGVTADTAGALIEAGAVALGVGGWLTRDHDREVIERRAREIVETVRRARTERAA